MEIANNSAFGRKVEVTIYVPDSSWSVVFTSNLLEGKQGLKINGTITKYFAVQPPKATIDIYNLSSVEVGNIMSARFRKVGDQYIEQPLCIKVMAGYVNGYYGEIFNGQILKPNMMRPDPNNTVLRLTCIDGAEFYSASSALTQTFNEGLNFYAVAQQIKDNSDVDFSLQLSPTLKDIKVDGSFVGQNTLSGTYQAIADQTGTVFSFKDQTAKLATWAEMINSVQDAFELTSQTGLIGIPSLSTDGIAIQSVLNPKLDVLNLIQLNNADISIQQPDFLTNRTLGAWLASDGLYRIIELTHEFDTTTGSFATTCRCLSRDYYNNILSVSTNSNTSGSR